MSGNKILVVAAHPDDEILGCGGTIARMIKDGEDAHCLILSRGIASRNGEKDWTEELKTLQLNAVRANKIIGIQMPIIIKELPDNVFDVISLLSITKIIETTIYDIKPNIIFTHYEHDLNIDHRITCQAVVTATRPVPENTVKEIYSFEIPSSTEWTFSTSFNPDVFWDIGTTFKLKIEALKCYQSEMREFPHPRSETGITTLAMMRGMQVGLKCAEAFKTVRVIR